MDDVANPNLSEAPQKGTGPLKPGTGPLRLHPRDIHLSLPARNFLLRGGELFVFLVAVVGAVALGLGITEYFSEHVYIGAYLLAYIGFRCADLLVREDYGPDPASDALTRRIFDQLPLLILFAIAPFERTYLYGGEPHKWMTALALLIELLGLWIALGARIQLGFFSWEKREGMEERVLVRNGFYRFIRHPSWAGVFLALIAWPLAYNAPISLVLTVVVGVFVMRNLIEGEERELLERFPEAYAAYRKETDALIPNLW
jgi:protein-S-isoprenylcysteine O-methyltransferase Ste14